MARTEGVSFQPVEKHGPMVRDSLRVAWEARNRTIAAENAALLERAPLRIRTGREP